MEVFVHRQPKGYLTKDLEDVKELGELLTNYGPLADDDEVTAEITGPWSTIKELLSHPVFMSLFGDIWFNPKTDERIKGH